MHETPQEIDDLQALLDASYAGAGPHLRDVINEERRIGAAQLCAELTGLCLLALATSTRDGRPINGPVDGYLLHGAFCFTSSRESVRFRHLAVRPAVSALYLPGDEMSVAVHGRAELFERDDAGWPELRQAMLDEYLPKQGPSFEEWIDTSDILAARIVPERMFTFQLTGS